MTVSSICILPPPTPFPQYLVFHDRPSFTWRLWHLSFCIARRWFLLSLHTGWEKVARERFWAALHFECSGWQYTPRKLLATLYFGNGGRGHHVSSLCLFGDSFLAAIVLLGVLKTGGTISNSEIIIHPTWASSNPSVINRWFPLLELTFMRYKLFLPSNFFYIAPQSCVACPSVAFSFLKKRGTRKRD